MKINENLRKSMKIDDSSQLESSKAFYRGHSSPLTVLGIHTPESLKIMKIYENHQNLGKSMKIDDSSQLESSKAFYRCHRLRLKAGKLSATRSMKNHQKSMIINEKPASQPVQPPDPMNR